MQHVAREYSVDAIELMRVAEMMDVTPPVIPADMSVGRLSDLIARGDTVIVRRQGTLIANPDPELVGIITRSDKVRALQSDPTGAGSVLHAGKRELVVTDPDEPLRAALETMLQHNVGRLPVVEREHPKRIVGYVGRSRILAARLRLHQEEEVRERGRGIGSFSPG